MTCSIGRRPRVECPRCARLVGTCEDEVSPVAHSWHDAESGVPCRAWPTERARDWRPTLRLAGQSEEAA